MKDITSCMPGISVKMSCIGEYNTDLSKHLGAHSFAGSWINKTANVQC